MAEEKPKPLKPKLYFNTSVPYEHEIVAYGQLNPKLMKKVDSILNNVSASRRGVVTLAIISTIRNFTALLPAAVSVMYSLRGIADEEAAGERVEFGRPMANIVAPYLVPAVLTQRLTGTIKKIAANGESPFWR